MPSVIKSKVSAYTVPRSGGKKKIRLEVDLLHEDGRIEPRKTKVTGLDFSEVNMVVAKDKFLPIWINILEESAEEINEVVNKSELVFHRLGAKYLDNLNPDNRGYSGEGYKRKLEYHIYPVFGNMDVTKVTVAQLQDWINDFMKGKEFTTGRIKDPRSIKTLTNCLTPFHGVFNRAVNEGILDVNPLTRLDEFIRSIKVSQQKVKVSKKKFNDDGELVIDDDDKSINPYTKKEIDALIEAADGWFKDYIILSFYTAMRPSEILYLKWDSVHIIKKFIVIQGAITGKETLEERELTKTISSRRKINLSQQALEALKRQATRTKHSNNKCNAVFLNQNKQHYSSSKVINDLHMKKLFGLAKDNKSGKLLNNDNPLSFNYKPVKQLRHSFASYVLTQDIMPIGALSSFMGHTTIEITIRNYAKFMPDDEDYILKFIDLL